MLACSNSATDNLLSKRKRQTTRGLNFLSSSDPMGNPDFRQELDWDIMGYFWIPRRQFWSVSQK